MIVTLFMAATESVHILFTAATDSVYGCNRLHIRLQQTERAATDSLYIVAKTPYMVATDSTYTCNRQRELQQTLCIQLQQSCNNLHICLQQTPYMAAIHTRAHSQSKSLQCCYRVSHEMELPLYTIATQGAFPIKITAVLL